MGFLKPKTSCKTSCFFLNDAMFWRCFWKNIDVDVFDDVLQNAKHRAYDASNDVNRPPLRLAPTQQSWSCRASHLGKAFITGPHMVSLVSVAVYGDVDNGRPWQNQVQADTARYSAEKTHQRTSWGPIGNHLGTTWRPLKDIIWGKSEASSGAFLIDQISKVG